MALVTAREFTHIASLLSSGTSRRTDAYFTEATVCCKGVATVHKINRDAMEPRHYACPSLDNVTQKEPAALLLPTSTPELAANPRENRPEGRTKIGKAAGKGMKSQSIESTFTSPWV